jgi:hypothetical protein
MVKRGPWVLLALLAAGCPDELGRGSSGTVEVGLLAPTDLGVEYDGGSRIVLRWSDHSTGESGYRLERSSTPFESPTIADVRYLPADSASIVYPTAPNSTYYFRVFATTATRESDPSNVCIASTPNVPAQPGGVDARPHTTSEIAVSWTDVSGETSYVIERSSDGGATWLAAGTAPANATAFISGGMAPDSEAAHRIVAVNPFGRSTPSDAAFAQTTTASMTFVTLPMAGNYGTFTSCAVEPGGREHVAHYDVGNSNVLYSTRLLPGAFVTSTVDGGPSGFEDVGGDGTGIAVDSSGNVHVVAHNRTQDTLRYATDAAGAWKAVTLDLNAGGAQPRIVFDRAGGDVHLSYLGSVSDPLVPSNHWIRYTRRKPGGAWRPPEDMIGSLPAARHSLALGPDARPYLASIHPFSQIRVFYATSFTPAPPGGVPPMTLVGLPPVAPPSSTTPLVDTALAVDDAGGVHVFFYTGALYHAEYSGAGWTVTTVDEQGGIDVGAFCAAAVEPTSRRIHLAYYDATRKDLRYARKDPGGPWVRRVIEALGDVGSHASIGVDDTGRVTIAYRDETSRRLRVAAGRP